MIPQSLKLAVLSASVALAGHGLWEPKIVYQPAIAAVEMSLATSYNTVNGSGIAHDLHKRWLGFNPGSGNPDDKLWPNKQIRYCWESAATKQILEDDLIEAASKWTNMGLASPEYSYQDVGILNQAPACASDRVNILLIKYSAPGTGPGQSQMATSVGKVPAGLGRDGPTMTLTDDVTFGMLDRVANYAHELGHAWGLHHEHQNPFFWQPDYGSQPDGTMWGSGNWNCQNLKDYQRVQQDIAANIQRYGEFSYGDHVTRVCMERAIAKLYSFSAWDYLPIPLAQLTYPSSSTTDVDWDSIMLYPSGAGGSGSATPGGADNRAPILRKPDLSLIPINLNPSSGDVEGIKTLYAEKSVTNDGPLLDDPRNPKNNIFRRLRNKLNKC